MTDYDKVEYLSEEWYAARIGKITGSRIGKVLDISPHGTPSSLMREMVREHFGAEREFTGNIATDWGHDHEADCVDAYERQTGNLTHSAQILIPHPQHDRFIVTVDGLVGLDGVFEAKAPFRALYNTVSERPDIEAQVRLQIECAQARFGDLGVWRPGGFQVSRIDDNTGWFETVLGECEKFLADYDRVIADPELAEPHLAPLVDERTDDEWRDAAEQWHEAQLAKARAEALASEAAERLKKLADGKKSKGHGVQVYYSTKKGALKTSAIEAAGIDLDPYRGPSTRVAAVTKAKR